MIKKQNKKKFKKDNQEIEHIYIRDSEVQITVEKEYAGAIFQLIRKLRLSKAHSYSYDFKRRIVPFFLQKFYFWCRDHEHPAIEKLLKEIKENKVSKQKKFELGDIQQLFGAQRKNENSDFQEELRKNWIFFLQHAEEICINGYLRIQKSRENYIRAAQVMLEEMQKPVPFEKFLSQKQ